MSASRREEWGGHEDHPSELSQCRSERLGDVSFVFCFWFWFVGFVRFIRFVCSFAVGLLAFWVYHGFKGSKSKAVGFSPGSFCDFGCQSVTPLSRSRSRMKQQVADEGSAEQCWLDAIGPEIRQGKWLTSNPTSNNQSTNQPMTSCHPQKERVGLTFCSAKSAKVKLVAQSEIEKDCPPGEDSFGCLWILCLFFLDVFAEGGLFDFQI